MFDWLLFLEGLTWGVLAVFVFFVLEHVARTAVRARNPER